MPSSTILNSSGLIPNSDSIDLGKYSMSPTKNK